MQHVQYTTCFAERLTLCSWKDNQVVTVLSGHPYITAATDEPRNVKRIEKDKKTTYPVTLPQPSLIRLFAENLRGCDVR